MKPIIDMLMNLSKQTGNISRQTDMLQSSYPPVAMAIRGIACDMGNGFLVAAGLVDA